MVQKNNTSILTAVEKASRVVVALKMYVHATSEGIKKHFDLLKSVETVLTIYSNQLKQGVDVRLNIPKNIDLYGYEDQIGQVWTNILVNACQAMQFRGSLTIDAEKNGDKVIVKIADSGEGISSELGDKIFEPFFSTKKIGEGSGLGLDIVRKIVEQHGGRIYYRSELSVGTTFYVELPLKSTEDAQNV
jgi:signal transduction histidine kinase